ncbi:SpoIIE family protein phosphatase [Thioalkalicoccus limnaeus]|uniref:SpoIIE family protein phosphatase n=1 Tax=Thioalkalicoccus limnaeus TaxID=120681 RepID=A0ABV4BAR2_9GAMM
MRDGYSDRAARKPLEIGAATKEARRAGDLLKPVEPITASHTNDEVAQCFAANPTVQNLPVLHAERPMGLINRGLFDNMMSKPYYRELYGRQSCIAFMDKNPLVVESDMTIEAVTALAIETGEKVFADGFILVDKGRYRGVGQVMDLLQAMTELQARQHRQLSESIDYAGIIQSSLMKPSRHALTQTFPDGHWVLWRPRDTVGGDLFHFTEAPGGFLAALFDCTGHGVPGALMTLIADAAFERAIAQHGHDDPAALIASMNRRIKHTLGQFDNAPELSPRSAGSDDGLDGLLVRGWIREHRLVYAGARLPLFRVLAGNPADCEVLRSDRHGVGYAATPADMRWSNHSISVTPKDRYYLVSDGILDQIGGPRRIAFGKRRLTRFLVESRTLGMAAQKDAFAEMFSVYQGNERVRDDLTILGLEWPGD